jgi:hypothetical protein
MDYSEILKQPDYMDRFTGIVSDKYSEYKIAYELSFTDTEGNRFEGSDIRVPAATAGTFEIAIRNDGKTIREGEYLSIYIYNGSLAHEMQKENPEGKDYISIENTGSAELELFEKVPGFSKVCRIYIKSGKFKRGNSITIRIGDRRYGGMGSNTYWTAGKSYLFLEAGSLGNVYPVEGAPLEFEITARGDGRFIRILGPTVAKSGEPQRIHIGIFDNCGNLMEMFTDTIVIEGRELEISGGIGILDGVVFKKTGIYRLEAGFKDAAEKYLSNPITVKEKPEEYIFWGDLHAHGWGDSTMHLMHVSNEKTSPLARHEQARDIGRLDFSAPGPMSFPQADRRRIWNDYRDACKKTNKPGHYVPFLSYEAHPVPEGDRNVFFKNINEELPPDFRLSMAELEKTYGFRNDVFLEVHIGGRIPRWCDYLPARERMIEAVSAFGNAEWLLQEALDRGFKPAVCGSSDLHYGLMGGPRTIEESRGRFFKYLNKRDSAYGTGPVTAVKAGELTRDAIWEAFEKRHTYATTDRRIFMDFKVNGFGFGDEIKEASEYKIEISVKGTDKIHRIDVVSGKYIIKSFKPDKMDYDVMFSISCAAIKGDHIYLKAMQQDGAFAICSPVYIEFSNEKWNCGDVFSSDRDKAAAFKPDMVKYLRTEEDINKFSNIEPIGIIDEKITKCALFHARLGEREISIRWYYEYEIPRIRMDWGRTNIGIMNDEITYRI